MNENTVQHDIQGNKSSKSIQQGYIANKAFNLRIWEISYKLVSSILKL